MTVIELICRELPYIIEHQAYDLYINRRSSRMKTKPKAKDLHEFIMQRFDIYISNIVQILLQTCTQIQGIYKQHREENAMDQCVTEVVIVKGQKLAIFFYHHLAKTLLNLISSAIKSKETDLSKRSLEINTVRLVPLSEKEEIAINENRRQEKKTVEACEHVTRIKTISLKNTSLILLSPHIPMLELVLEKGCEYLRWRM
ncbi:hypothetical protein FF38_01243 [Lucilia cuprina]|uniref:Uncharacterized protein n=1 Tax=Lucilia cuprina TaxID=7375 RepID=A0A0L0CHD7_LUCCU|nr:hypothetical protein FF38_01243 [Lucilia cuprina]